MVIESNGNGRIPAPLEALLNVLATSIIDPYWGTYILPSSTISDRKMLIAGNFLGQSWVYRVRAPNGSEEGERLLQAVLANPNSERFTTAARKYPVWPQRAFPSFMDMADKLGVSSRYPWTRRVAGVWSSPPWRHSRPE